VLGCVPLIFVVSILVCVSSTWLVDWCPMFWDSVVVSGHWVPITWWHGITSQTNGCLNHTNVKAWKFSWFLHVLQPRAAQKSTAESKANSGISTFFSRDTEKPVKPTKSVAKGSQNGERSPPGAHGNIVEENCTSKSHQEKQDLPNKKKELSNSVKNNNIKHTGKRVGSAKSRKMSTSKELLPAKKLKRIVFLTDSEGSSDDGE